MIMYGQVAALALVTSPKQVLTLSTKDRDQSQTSRHTHHKGEVVTLSTKSRA